MRLNGILSVVIGSVAASALSGIGPVANEDDQFRGIWGFGEKAYEEIRDTGFNLFIGGAVQKECYEKMAADQIGFMLQIGNIPLNAALRKKYPRYRRDGSVNTETLDCTEPGCLEAMRPMVRAQAEVMKGNPAFIGMQPATEVRIHTHPSFSPRHAASYRAFSGCDVPEEAKGRAAPNWRDLKDLPADRLIDDSFNVYRFYRWFWATDDGFGPYFDMAVDEFEAVFGKGLFTMFDPATRCPPMWGSGGKVTHIDDWQVCQPFPFQHSYLVAKQQAMARGRNQKVLTIVQGIFCRIDSCPIGEFPEGAPDWCRDRPKGRYVTPPPDMMREAFWSVLAHQIDGVLVHGWNCIYDGAKYGLDKNGAGYQFTNPETRKMIADLFARMAIPLGPLFKAAEEREPTLALYEALPSALLSGRAPYDWKEGLQYQFAGIVATAANLSPYVLYDDEILRDGIPASVRVILAPQAQVLTKRVAERLRAFQSRGGKILARSDFAPGMKSDGLLPPSRYETYGYRHKSPKDPNFPAERMLADLRLAAKEFKAAAREQGMTPFADSDRGEILVRARRAGRADLVFAYSDNRAYGPYVGPWKRDLERSVPCAGTLVLDRTAGAVYDLVAHRPVAFSVTDGKTRIPVSYGAEKGGDVFLVTDRALSPLAVSAERSAEGLAVTVTTADRDCLLPIGVAVGAARPYYGVLRDGVWRHAFKEVATDASVVVQNLADGSRVSR